MGFTARGVASAEEALELLATDPHDILILDLHLPGITGIELFERVRHRSPETQGIILTAYGELAAAQQAIRLRIAEFLTKPCHLSDIEAALERARKLFVSAQLTATPTPAPSPPAVTLEEMTKQRIADALAKNRNNKAATARELGISRRSLYDRLNQLDQ
jgi:DNA-binding NtrC family response regulator